MAESALPEPLPGLRTRRRRAAVGHGLPVVAVVAVVAFGWWLTHPDALRGAGDEVSAPQAVGKTLVFGEVASVDRPVTIVAVEPRLTSGDATVEVKACRPSGPRTRIGVVRPIEVSRYCEDVRSPAGVTVSPLDGWYLFAEVTRHSAEPAHVEGFDVAYRDGWRRGTQTTGVRIVLEPLPQ